MRAILISMLMLAQWSRVGGQVPDPVIEDLNVPGASFDNLFEGLDLDFLGGVEQPPMEQIRWLTLFEKAGKLRNTKQLIERKERENELHREQLGKLKIALGRILAEFRAHYEKFRIVASTVRSIQQYRKFGQRVKGLVQHILALQGYCTSLENLSPEELDRIATILQGMAGRTGRILEEASLAMLGENDPASKAELDRIREEHGEFWVLIRSADRTQILSRLDGELKLLLMDIQQLGYAVHQLSRARSSNGQEGLRLLFDDTP